MRIIHCRQRSEEWEALRARPTASEFKKFCTAVKGDYSAAAGKYASEVVAKKLGIYIESPPSDAMEWGIHYEPEAIEAYTAQTGRQVTEAGFILPDHTDTYGGSPDGLVGPDGLLEVKCPQAQTLIWWFGNQKAPIAEYKPQLQGLLWISGREWIDFWGYHPYIEKSLLIRVYPDLDYHEKLAKAMQQLLAEIERIERLMT